MAQSSKAHLSVPNDDGAIICAICYGQVIDGRCRRCDRVGGKTMAVNAPSSSESDDDADGTEHDAVTESIELESMRVQAEEERANALSLKMKQLPAVDVTDVVQAKTMNPANDDCFNFATKREIAVQQKADKVLQRERPLAVERALGMASSSTKDDKADPRFTVQRRAHRLDPLGKEVDAGKWDLTDVKGRYHLTHVEAGDVVNGERVDLVPIAGSNIAVDQYREDKFVDFIEGVDKSAARVKHERDLASTHAARQKVFDLNQDYNMRFALRHKEIDKILQKKDTHMAKLRAQVEDQINAHKTDGQKAEAVDASNKKAQREVRELHGDVENGRFDRLSTVLKMQHMDEDVLAGMSEWERYQLKTVAERQDLYTVTDINAADDLYGNTALFKAVGRGDAQMAKLLLQYGANPNLLNYLGESPVHHCWRAWDTLDAPAAAKEFRAYARNTFDVLRALVEAGADINVQDSANKNSPLHIAARFGPTSIVQFLLEHGGDVHSVNARHQTPVDIARALKGKCRHADESANILTRWTATQDGLRLHEFRNGWHNFLKNPAHTLMGQTAKETVEKLDNDIRKQNGQRLARGGRPLVVDSLSDAYDASAKQRRDSMLHEQEIKFEKMADKNLSSLRKAIARGARDDRQLKVRLDDYLHRDRDPGFRSREEVEAEKDARRNRRTKKYDTKKDAKAKRERELARQKSRSKQLEREAEMKTDAPLRYRRLQAARELMKDVVGAGSAKTFGRPAVNSSIWHSGSGFKYNALNKDPALSKNRIDPKHLESATEVAKQYQQRTVVDAPGDAAGAQEGGSNASPVRKPLNPEFALAKGHVFQQQFKKRGALWIVGADRRRPDFELAQLPPRDPWANVQSKDDQADHRETTFDRLGIEGFDQLQGKNPYQTTASNPSGTTLELLLGVRS